jgi:hypothetical protein
LHPITRVILADVGGDEGVVVEEGQVVGAEMAGIRGRELGRIRTRRAEEIIIGREGTTKRWPRQEARHE